MHVHHKVYLPTYGLFDEGRFFAWGDSIRAFDTRWGRVGLLICEDFWHASPPYLLWLDGADLMLFCSASPGRGLGQSDKLELAWWVEHVNRAYASLFTAFVAHSNRVGFEDGLHFWGGSTVFDPNGELVAQGPTKQKTWPSASWTWARCGARAPACRCCATSATPWCATRSSASPPAMIGAQRQGLRPVD